LLLASQNGEAANRARERILNSAKAETVTVAGRVGGDDAGAICDLAPDYRLGVGPVSSKWLGDGVRKKGEENNTNIQPLVSCLTTIYASAGVTGGLHGPCFA